ncbi:MAG TPA: DUF3616 domain-containing protein [Burkholderiaceae bacterium]|nr:DUF3616 domain-containing protein [Burkholderiaceae bacterium]
MDPDRRLTLEFRPALDDAGGRKELRDGLSTVMQLGRTLWVANDESSTVERLTLHGDRAADHRQFRVGDFVDLPDPGTDGDAPEIDVEGMATADGWLWLVGSHSLKRCRVDPDASVRKSIRRFARPESQANRCLLARIPIVERDGLPELARKARPRRAQRLPGDAGGNALTRLLREDPHLAPFLGLPGKENGFDVEGLAIAGTRLFLGLRGPVLRGWAVVLELRPAGDGRALALERFEGRKGARVRKHFLQLGGLGVRDLCLDGDDLLVLAGPTMSLDGPVRVLRWREAARGDAACVLPADRLDTVIELAYGMRCDHAEGLALYREDPSSEPALLVVHDSPSQARQVGASGLLADVFELRRR